ARLPRAYALGYHNFAPPGLALLDLRLGTSAAKAGFFRGLAAGLKACSTLCLKNESFKHLIREQAPARGQSQVPVSRIQQSIGGQLFNYRDKPFDLGAETLSNFIQVNPAIEPQSQKEILFESLSYCDWCGLNAGIQKELIERIRRGKPQALDSLSTQD